MIRLFCTILFLLSQVQSYAQVEGRLSSFSAKRIDRSNVQIRWVMRANVSCQSPQVQRSKNGVDFTTVYTYPGICGGSNVEEAYSWIDNKPLDQFIQYYRLRIDEGEFSLIAEIKKELILNDEQLNVFPNPTNGAVNLHYDPDLGDIDQIKAYDNAGGVISTFEKESLEVDNGTLSLNINENVAGLIFLEVFFENGLRGRLKLLRY